MTPPARKTRTTKTRPRRRRAACNVPNRTLFCHDNLEVMQGINDACIDLIYLDPPFNKNKTFTAPIGSTAKGASFKDIFREEDLKEEWLETIAEYQALGSLFHYLEGVKEIGKPYNFAYLAYMAIRLIECRRILRSTGSIYLHCDQTMSHYLKLLMDTIFGEENFKNEVIWRKYAGRKNNATRKLSTQRESLLLYTKSREAFFEPLFIPHSEKEIEQEYKYTDKKKGRYRLSRGGAYQATGRQKRIYLKDSPGRVIGDLWVEDGLQLNTSSAERTGYPTQKPLALLERVILLSSKKGAMVLDPFCGCATTCVAAERLDRQWIGIDVSHEAADLVRERLKEEVDKDQHDWIKGPTRVRIEVDPPVREDRRADHREKRFVYVVSHPQYPGEYKVGIAKNVETRLGSFRTSAPDRRYKIEFKMETHLFREIEAHIHTTFPNKHEWVEGDLKAIIRAIRSYKPQSSAKPKSSRKAAARSRK